MWLFGSILDQTIICMTRGGWDFLKNHCAHIHTKGELVHGQNDPKSMAQMSLYAPWMSQVLKDHIWTQLSLRHMVKQIYNKHKVIWWAWVNMRSSWWKKISLNWHRLLRSKTQGRKLVVTCQLHHLDSNLGL